MSPKLTLGYRTAVADHDHLLGVAGRRVTGHEFHRTRSRRPPLPAPTPAGCWRGSPTASPWTPPAPARRRCTRRTCTRTGPATPPSRPGSPTPCTPTPPASGSPARWTFCRAAARPGPGLLRQKAGRPDHRHEDLDHHGDADAAEGLVDLAVNVRLPVPPDWLAGVIRDSVDDLAAYPDPTRARRPSRPRTPSRWSRCSRQPAAPSCSPRGPGPTLDRARGRAPSVHRAGGGACEPRATTRAGCCCPPADGFRLDPARVPADADLVIIGNPTNPTGVLHPAEPPAAAGPSRPAAGRRRGVHGRRAR